MVSHFKTDQLAIVLDQTQSFALDNGAFSHWKQSGGEGIDFEAYVDWVSSLYRHPGFDFCLIPDVIDGELQDNVGLINRWCRMGISPKGVPVFHMDEPDEWLAELVADWQMVAIGSSGKYSTPGTQTWWRRMDQIMQVCCDEEGRPKIKLHGLRMLSIDIFKWLPLSSADSTNAGRHKGDISRFGMYPAPSAGARAAAIASRIEAVNSAPVWLGRNQLELL